MARVAYKATKAEFVRDWDENLFMDKMCLGASQNQIGIRENEKRSWQNNAAKLVSLLRIAEAPDDIVVAFEYKAPTSGRIDCMLFAIGKDGKRNVIHIELKQWSNDSVRKAYDTGVFRVCAQVGRGYRILSHPSKQALGYQQNIENYNSMVCSPGTNLRGWAYCYNYAHHRLPNDLFDSHYDPVMRICPLEGADDVRDFAVALKDLLAGGRGVEVFNAFISCPDQPTRNLIDSAANMFCGKTGFVLVEDQLASADTIYGMIEKVLAHPEKKMALIVKGGPGTGKTVIALKVISELALHHRDIKAFFTTRSSALRETLKKKLEDVTTGNGGYAADVVQNIYSFRPYNFKEGGADVVLIDEAHRIRNSSNYMADRGDVKTFLPQVLSLLYSAKVSVFFIDDKQGVKREEVGQSGIIREFAENYACCIRKAIDVFRMQIERTRERLRKIEARITELSCKALLSPEDGLCLRKLMKRRDKQRLLLEESYQLDQVQSSVKTVEVEEIELKTQFRCNGSDNFLDWLDSVIYEDSDNVIKFAPKFGGEYVFDVLDSPSALEHKIRSLNAPSSAPQQVARLVAGWCWEWSDQLDRNGDLRRDVVIGDWSMPWETNNAKPQGEFAKCYAPSANAWATHPMGINQVGCIFSVQGFEVDYVGVILGPDIRYDEECRRIVGVKDKTYGIMRGTENYDILIKNIYRVLLSRGRKGCYIYLYERPLSRVVRLGRTSLFLDAI